MPESVLLVQNSAPKAAMVRQIIDRSDAGSFVIEWVRTCDAALDRLESQTANDIAAVMLDLPRPGGKALESLDRIILAAPHIPILVFAGSKHENIARQAIQHGAQDYILESRLDAYSLSKALRNMLERRAAAEALFAEQARAQVTLNSIGDGVISTDAAGNVTYLNQVAESLTGWTAPEALGRPFGHVFRIIDGKNPGHTVNPMAVVMRDDKTVGLGASCVLVRRDGTESPIEDSAAPIHDRRGRVTGAVMVFHDVTDARASSQRMAHLAHHDYLTGLPNRLSFDDRLAQAMASARRHKEKLAVLFVDVDRFKRINDSLGHAIGDELLRSIAGRLGAGVRASDTVSRQGGDEFVVLLSTVAHPEDAALIAKKLLASLGRCHRVKEHNLHITVSVGIGIYPADGSDAETLVKNADIAMLNAKNNGRNNYQFFRPDMNAHALERQLLENGLRRALDERQFVLFYQPKVNLQTRAITGVEALVRWRHPVRGMVPPEKFIPIAEQCGYIVPIGRWVLREACRQMQSWVDAGLAPIQLAVNVSAVELRSKDFAAGVRAVLDGTGLDPRRLELELTETALVQDPGSTAAVLKSIGQMGIRLALDDFGTGYSSLSYLKGFPIDALKIDKSFVRGLCTNADDANIVSAVINMAKSFRLKVVAEGVETRQQFLALRTQRCAEGQGNYFQAPVSAGEFAELLKFHSPASVPA